MRKSLLAAAGAVVVASLALTLPAAAASPASGSLMPPGSLWDLGAAPACQTVTAPPPTAAGTAPIILGQPGQPGQWCWEFARIGASGAVTLPGGVPGERLTPAAYAAQTGQTVTVAYSPSGAVVVYLF